MACFALCEIPDEFWSTALELPVNPNPSSTGSKRHFYSPKSSPANHSLDDSGQVK